MNLRLRQGLIQIHLWSGLTIGALLGVTALGGAMLAWRQPLERRWSHELYVVVPGQTRLPPDELVQRARAAHAGAVESVRYFGNPTAAFQVYFSNRDYVHLNPYTGAVLGVRPRYGDFFGWIEGLHKMLHLQPTVGEPIMGANAMIFGLVIITGLVLAWPASRRALQALATFNWKLSGRRWHLHLHKTLGTYASLIVLVSVITGLPIALDWVKDSFYPLTGSKPIDPPKPKLTATGFAGFTAMSVQLDRLAPAAEESYIAAPKNGVVSSYAVAAGSSHPNARSYLWLNPANAAILKWSPYAQAGAGFRLYFWMLSFHTGKIGGWPVRIVLCLGALSVPILICTGLTSFLMRKKKAKPAEAQVAERLQAFRAPPATIALVSEPINAPGPASQTDS